MRRLTPAIAAAALVLSMMPAPGLARQSVVIYRCTDASGAVTVQNDVACPKGSQQQRRVIETETPPYNPLPPPAIPAPLVAAEQTSVATVIEAPAANAPADVRPPIPLAERTAPPPLFACKTWSREEYLSDDPVPAERCAPMQTTGLGGDPAQGAGAACLVVSDFCQPVPEATLCERWRDHLIRAEANIEFDRARDPAAAKTDLERLRTIVAQSTCG